MAGFRSYEVVEHSFYAHTPSPFPFPFPPFIDDDDDELTLALGAFPAFGPAVYEDLFQIETAPASYKRVVVTRRRAPAAVTDVYLQRLCERVEALESKFDRAVKAKAKAKAREQREVVDRKYSWTAEIGGPVERKYKLTTEIKGEKKANTKTKTEKKVAERNYKWTAEIKGKDDEKRIYTWKATIGGDKEEGRKKGEKTKKKDNKVEGRRSCVTRFVEIEEPSDHRAVILRQAFARRGGAATQKGKQKELSPQDAAMMIQITFREYLIRRSRCLRALRDLAIAKTKLKELRALFHNFSYRSRVSRDSEERQKFSEKIIVLLLTVDSIEGVDIMVRAAKRSMVDELEGMLDVVEPQSTGRSLSMRRRTFDMPSGDIPKELAEGVAQVVRLIEEEEEEDEASV